MAAPKSVAICPLKPLQFLPHLRALEVGIVFWPRAESLWLGGQTRFNDMRLPDIDPGTEPPYVGLGRGRPEAAFRDSMSVDRVSATPDEPAVPIRPNIGRDPV